MPLPWLFAPHRPRPHPFVVIRRAGVLLLIVAWALLLMVTSQAQGAWFALGVVLCLLLTTALGLWGWPWLFYPWSRVVQWRVRMNAKVPPDWPIGFSPFVHLWKPVVEAAWLDMDDVRAWLSHHASEPPEWVVHEEQNIPLWAQMSRSGTCLENDNGQVLRLWLVLDETSTWHQPYFKTCRAQGMPLTEVVYGMIAHEMGHAVDLMMREHHPQQAPFDPRDDESREAVADVWEAMSTFYPVEAPLFAQRVTTLAQARAADHQALVRRMRDQARVSQEHDTSRHLLALLERPDLHDVRKLWPMLPVAVRMRWTWAHVAYVNGLPGQLGGNWSLC